MTQKNALVTEEKEENNVIDLIDPKYKALPGGKDPTHNWLAELPQGTLFLCRKRNPGAGQVQLVMDEYTLDNNTFKHYKLHDDLNAKMGVDRFVWVNPREFCVYHELVEVLQEGKQ